MTQTKRLKFWLTGAVSASTLMMAGAAWGQGAQTHFDIPAQGLGQALTQLSDQAGISIFAPADLVAGKRAPALSGTHSTQDALNQLLAGSGLVAVRDESGAVLIRAREEASAPVATPTRQAQADGPVEVITVTGERAINLADIAQKRAVDQVYDSINVDEIGALPDFNIPDAFRRVAGVSAIFDEDEGQFVTARGMPLSYNYTTFDGMGVATVGGFGDGSRNVNMQAIPRTAIKRLEIFKTHTPDLDLGWIGGYFNAETRSAFDADGLYFVGRGQLNYYTMDDVPNVADVGADLSGTLGGRAEFTFSNTFGNNDQFGILFAGTYYYKSRDQWKYEENSTRHFGPDANNDGVGDINFPAHSKHLYYTNMLERYGALVKLEWQPFANTNLSWSNFVYSMFESETRMQNNLHGFHLDTKYLGPDGYPVANPADTKTDFYFDTPTSGTFRGLYGKMALNYFPNDRQHFGSILNLDHTFANEAELSLALGVTTAQHGDDFIPEVDLRTKEVLSGRWELRGVNHYFELDEASRTCFYSEACYTNVANNSSRSRYSHERVWTLRGDYDWHTRGYAGFGFKLGFEVRDLDRKRDNEKIRYVRPNNQALPDGYLIMTDFELPQQPGRPAAFIDLDAFNARADFTIDEDNTYHEGLQNDFNYTEQVRAGYLMGTYTGDRFKLIGGLRYEDVDVGGWYYARRDVPGRDLFIPQEIDGGYDFLKPSALFMYDVSEDLRFKAAFSQTLGRPNPDQVATSGEKVSINDVGEMTAVTRGNPDLRPRQSNNYDLSLEYFFDGEESLFSIGFFHKDISDEIVQTLKVETIVFEGVEYPDVEVKQPRNIEGSRVTGIESQLIKSRLDFLPAPFDRFGFRGNLMWTDAELRVPAGDDVVTLDYLPYQAGWVGNAALTYYWPQGVETRLAYSYLGPRRTSATTNLGSDKQWDTFQTWDFAVRYRLNDQLRIEFDAKNLTDENRESYRGPKLDLQDSYVEFGRSYYLGVTYRY
ncbi:TonB-dependent receptor [Woodsholea maritima]|uniref:TonB-dependent receptor n=1 Tax=Woodsholea maritima TaxID=240237 RepID=UPI0003A4DFA2|nr:TonB-dependent receptor [Woodsholea maritima]